MRRGGHGRKAGGVGREAAARARCTRGAQAPSTMPGPKRAERCHGACASAAAPPCPPLHSTATYGQGGGQEGRGPLERRRTKGLRRRCSERRRTPTPRARQGREEQRWLLLRGGGRDDTGGGGIKGQAHGGWGADRVLQSLARKDGRAQCPGRRRQGILWGVVPPLPPVTTPNTLPSSCRCRRIWRERGRPPLHGKPTPPPPTQIVAASWR